MARHWIPWMLAFFFLMQSSSPIFSRQLSEVEMPEAMETEAGPLVLNGIGQRSVFAQSVYMAGLYLPEPEKNWREVVERDEPMAIRLHVTDAFFASSERLRDAFSKGFRNTMPDGDISPIRDKAQDFIACFEDRLHTHDEFVIAYIPEKGTRVLKNGKSKGLFSGRDFKKAVFGIWLGETPAQESLKDAMLAADVSQEALALQSALKMAADEKKKGKKAKLSAGVQKPETADKAGMQCEEAPLAEATPTKVLEEPPDCEDIYFPLGENRLTEAARMKLNAKARWLKSHPGVRVIIEGHSDSRGPESLNFDLAKKRAQRVKAYLAAAGVAQDRMAVKSYGEDRPAAAGQTPAAWAKNRRVHFTLIE